MPENNGSSSARDPVSGPDPTAGPASGSTAGPTIGPATSPTTGPVAGHGSKPPRRRSRAIYLLPNLFTTSALFAGFYSIICAQNGRFEKAAIAIIVAAVLDGFDGRVARLTNTTSAFGAEYDSMADMISFGMAPAFLMYAWALTGLTGPPWGQLGWVLAFVYTACCGLRLARFNVAVGTADKRFFQGLACPTAGVVLASLVWVSVDLGLTGNDLMFVAAVLTALAGALMVSNFAYYSFKDLGTNRRVPFVMLLGLLVLFVTTAVDPPKMILIAGLLYAASGPAWSGFSWLRKRNRQAI